MTDSKTPQEYLDLAKIKMDELDTIRSTLYGDLASVKVRLDKVKNADVYNAVVAIFGQRASDDPNKDYITFDMFMDCVRIIKAAGRSKGKETLNRQGI